MAEMELSTKEIDRIIGFLGYGRTTAPVWFVGIEEGLGKMEGEEPRQNLRARGEFNEVMDLQEAHLKLLEKKELMDFSVKKTFTQVWLWMAKIMLARAGAPNWNDVEVAKDYIRRSDGLGRAEGETFLTELSPIPEKNNSGKSWLREFSKTEARLVDKISERKSRLKQLLKNDRPSLVICYGSGRLDEFADLLGVEWNDSSVDRVQQSSDSECLLLPFFGNGRMCHSVIQGLIQAEMLLLS